MKYITLSFFLIYSLIYSDNICGQVVYNQSDSILFNQYIKHFADKKNLPVDQLIIETAKYFINTPYVAGTLENEEKESLVVNLQEVDCTTFVENCIALSECIKSDNNSFSSFCQILASIRYRDYTLDNGKIIIKDYTDRLHYMNDWVYENQQKNRIKDISLEIGGKKKKKLINYMSTHPQYYKHLNNNSSIRKLNIIENNISERNNYNIIPKSEIIIYEKQINDGDIIIFATNIRGLDYTHIGIAYRKIDGTLSFIHASSSKKKVLIENKSLINYCQNSNNCSGISVIRVNNQ